MVENPEEEKCMYIARLGGAVATGEPSYASLCVLCRECVGKCPQHRDIPDVLESVVKEFEGPGFEQTVAITLQMFRQIWSYAPFSVGDRNSLV